MSDKSYARVDPTPTLQTIRTQLNSIEEALADGIVEWADVVGKVRYIRHQIKQKMSSCWWYNNFGDEKQCCILELNKKTAKPMGCYTQHSGGGYPEKLARNGYGCKDFLSQCVYLKNKHKPKQEGGDNDNEIGN